MAAVQADCEVLWNRRIRSCPEEFAEIVGALPASPAGVAFEATYGWGWFADLLTDLGLPAQMSHPKGTKAIASARVKNDAVDAETLAQLLRTNLLPEAWIAPPPCREARRLVRTPQRSSGCDPGSNVSYSLWRVQRFPRPELLCSWAGLTPTYRSSMGHVRRGHISKQGSRLLRWALVEVATAAPRHEAHRRYFMKVLHNDRRRAKIARLALARRLLTLCHYALRDEDGCRAYPVAKRAMVAGRGRAPAESGLRERPRF